jgi:hypothetical protein
MSQGLPTTWEAFARGAGVNTTITIPSVATMVHVLTGINFTAQYYAAVAAQGAMSVTVSNGVLTLATPILILYSALTGQAGVFQDVATSSWNGEIALQPGQPLIVQATSAGSGTYGYLEIQGYSL